MLAALLAAILTVEAVDGGQLPVSDAPIAVQSAVAFDGGQVGQGWWLSPEKMTKVGATIVELRNERDAARFEVATISRPPDVPSSSSIWLWVGIAIGGILGASAIAFVDRLVPSK